MTFFKNLNNKIIKHDLINKYKYLNNQKVPKIKKIILNFYCLNFTIRKFAITLLAMELLTAKKSNIIRSKFSNVLLKIRKGQPIGCRVVLQKKHMYAFLDKLIIEFLPTLIDSSMLNVQISTSSISFQFSVKEMKLPELDSKYPLFEILPSLNISIVTTTTNPKELLFMAQTLKLSVKNNTI